MTSTSHYTHICLCVSVWLHKDSSANKADFCYLLASTTKPKKKCCHFSYYFAFFPPCQIIMWHTSYVQSHARLSSTILSSHFDLISPSWQIEPSKPIWACSASAKVGGWGGVKGGVVALLRQKNSDALFYFSPSRPLVLPFEILMLDGNPLWNCVMLGWVVRSQKWQLYLAITRFWLLGYVYVYLHVYVSSTC